MERDQELDKACDFFANGIMALGLAAYVGINALATSVLAAKEAIQNYPTHQITATIEEKKSVPSSLNGINSITQLFYCLTGAQLPSTMTPESLRENSCLIRLYQSWKLEKNTH